MLKTFKKLSLILIVVMLLVGLMPYPIAQAVITSCEADFDVNQMGTNSTTDFNLTLQDTNMVSINWVHVVSPSPHASIQNVVANGWNVAMTGSDITFTGNTIGPGSSLNAVITLSADNNPSNGQWAIQATDDPGGANPVTCVGQQGFTSVPSPPAVSNVNLSNLNATSVTVTWDSDVASDSEVNYGTDQSYGSTTNSSSSSTSHSLTLTGLRPNTGYHYMVSSSNDIGTGSSGDSTFLTAVEQSQVTKVVTVAGSTIVSPVEIQVTNASDITPPTIALSSKIPNVVQSMPTISGISGDDVAVVRVEYSTDGGHNWLPVDSAPLLGRKTVGFSFTPLNLDDGTYTLVARAIDPGGNVTMTPAFQVVVDRLPPIVGGEVIAFGPQVLQSDRQGITKTLAGIDLKVNISTVGGATSVFLTAQSSNTPSTAASFNLTRSADTNLWSGLLSFPKVGTYTLVAHAIDGAGNKTVRTINTLQVSAPARVETSSQYDAATVTAYYWEPDSNSWVVWDAAAYGETNPQITDKHNDFKLLLPSGKYYLKTTAKGYQSLTTQIFTLTKPTPITAMLKLKRGGWQAYLPWLNFSKQSINLDSNQVVAKLSVDVSQDKLINKILAGFTLSDTAGIQHNSIDWLGKPTVISVMSTWSPATAEQVGVLSQLQSNSDINVEPVALQENAARLRAYNQIADYQLNWLADPDSQLTAVLGTNNLSTHYFVDRKGIIRSVSYGVLSKEELLDKLSSL